MLPNSSFQPPLPPSHPSNLSISLETLDPSIFDKPDHQLTAQLYQMARRIAESDRNNELYRQAKKNKNTQLDLLKKKKTEYESQLREIEDEVEGKMKKIDEGNFAKANRTKFEQINSLCQDISQKQKQTQKSTLQLLTETEKLEKKLSTLQFEYDLLQKSSLNKKTQHSHLLSQKQSKQSTLQSNQAQISALQQQCQQTKTRAESLQQELSSQLQTQSTLSTLLALKQQERIEHKQKCEQQEKAVLESKRQIKKIRDKAKGIEDEIQMKLREEAKLKDIIGGLRGRIASMWAEQKKMEQIVKRRAQILGEIGLVSE